MAVCYHQGKQQESHRFQKVIDPNLHPSGQSRTASPRSRGRVLQSRTALTPKKLCVHCRRRSGERISSPLLGIFPTFSARPQKCGGCRVGPRPTHHLCPTAPSSRPATTALLLRTGLPLHGFSAHKYSTVPGSFPQTSEGNLLNASRSAFPLALPRETCARQWWERALLRDSNQLPSPSSTLMG